MQKQSRKVQKEQTRAGLVQRAEALFAAKGIAGTTTADVAKALRVSHGTVFIHFATRDQLIASVVAEFGDRLSGALKSELADGLPLADLLEAHLSVLARFEDFYLRLISESHSLPASIRSIVYAMNASISYRFYEAARPEMAAGKLKKLDQATFFNTWMAIVHYQILNRNVLSDKKPILSETGDALVRQFLTLVER
jgi:AcrR family transcriptional regulator